MFTALLAKFLPLAIFAQVAAMPVAASAPPVADAITNQDPRQYAAMTAIWIFCGVLGKILDGILDGKPLALWARMQPVLPLLLGMLVFWFIAPVATLPIDKLIQGMIYGASVSGFHKLGAQSVFGNDARVKKLKAIVGGVVPHKPTNPIIPPAP